MLEKAAIFLWSIGVGLLMTAAGLYFAAKPLATAGLVVVAVAVALWVIAKLHATPGGGSPTSPSTTFAKATGDAKLDIEDSFSSADTFFEAKGNSTITSKRNRHEPGTADDETGQDDQSSEGDADN